MRRLLVLLALLTVVISGCGGGDDSADTGGSDTSSSGGDSGDSGDAAAPEDLCAALSADDVSAATGLTLTGEATPGGGCTYGQDDPRDTSLAVSTIPTTAENGGFEAAVTGTKSVLSDVEETPVSGIGDDAIIVSGTFTGMSAQVTTGLVDLGGFAVVVQAIGGDEGAHAELTESVMKLGADTLG